MGRRQKVPLPATGKYRLFNLPVVEFSTLPAAANTRKRDSPEADDVHEAEWVSSDTTSNGSDSDIKIVSPVVKRTRSKSSGNSGSGSSGSGKATAAARKRLHANQKYDGPALRMDTSVCDGDSPNSPVHVRFDLYPAFVAWDKARTALESSKKQKPGNRLIRSEWFSSNSTLLTSIHLLWLCLTFVFTAWLGEDKEGLFCHPCSVAYNKRFHITTKLFNIERHAAGESHVKFVEQHRGCVFRGPVSLNTDMAAAVVEAERRAIPTTINQLKLAFNVLKSDRPMTE